MENNSLTILSNADPDDRLIQLFQVLIEARENKMTYVQPLDMAMCTGLDSYCLKVLASEENQEKVLKYLREYLMCKNRLVRKIKRLPRMDKLQFEDPRGILKYM